MNTATIVIIAFFVAGVIAAIVAGVWLMNRSHRTKELRSTFGSEYNRVARAEGDAARGEKVLQERQARMKKFEIKPLSAAQRNQFADAWDETQAKFVDNPIAAIAQADVLVKEVMKVRGYLVADFAQRVADVSVDHPAVVQNYRLAHEIAADNERGSVGLERLRQAMLHYRALFADLLHDGGMQPVRQVRPEEPEERVRRIA